MNVPLAKIKAILLYFSNNTDVKFLGKVKLMKLFYFLDFTHVKQHGSPVTYDTYIKLEHGPIPSTIKNMIDNASENIDESELADVITFETPHGTKMKRMLPRRKFSSQDAKLFSATEMEVMKLVCQKYGAKNTLSIEKASHKEAPWSETRYLQTIPYSFAAKDADSKVSKEEIELLMKISL